MEIYKKAPEPTKMKQPLKDKTQSHCHRKDLTDRHDIHDDIDIKSALDRFVKELKNEGLHQQKPISIVSFNKILNKWFKDITK